MELQCSGMHANNVPDVQVIIDTSCVLVSFESSWSCQEKGLEVREKSLTSAQKEVGNEAITLLREPPRGKDVQGTNVQRKNLNVSLRKPSAPKCQAPSLMNFTVIQEQVQMCAVEKRR